MPCFRHGASRRSPLRRRSPGSILAADGSGLPGARVTVLSSTSDTLPAAVVASGERGLYLVRALPPGSFQLRVELPGFETRTVNDVTLSSGERLDLDVTLRLAGVRESVTVVSPSPRDTVEAAEIRESSARDAAEALVTLPGVWKLRKRRHRERRRRSRVPEPRPECPRRRGEDLRRLPEPHGPADLPCRLRADRPGGSGQGTVRREEPGKPRRRRQHRHATTRTGPSRHGERRRRGVGLRQSVDLGFVGRRVLLRPRRVLLQKVDGVHRRRRTPFHRADELQRRRHRLRGLPRGDRVGPDRVRPGEGPGRHVLLHAAGHVAHLLPVSADGRRVRRLGPLRPDLGGNAFRRRHVGEAPAYYTQVDHWMTDEYRTSSATASRGWSMGTDAFSRSLGGRLEGTAWGVTAGVEAYRRYWDTTTYLAGMQYKPQASLPGATTDVVGLFAQRSFRLSAAVSLDAGVRWDSATASVDAEKASTDLTWAYHGTRATEQNDSLPAEACAPAGRPPRGSRSPSAPDRSRGSLSRGALLLLKRMGSDWVGNPDLSAPRNTALDLSASYRAGRLYVSASAFLNEVADFIVLADVKKVNMVPGVMNPMARTYENVDARLAGGEASAAVTLTGYLFFSGAVSYVRGTQTPRPELGILSENVAEMPPVTGRASLRWDNGRFWGEAEGVFAAAQTNVDTDLLESTTPGWGIANLRAGIAYGDIGLTVGVENLFGRLYSEHLSYQRDPFRSGVKIPEPGRNVFVNLSYRY
ncbi:MAG: TonB-dependent receptor [Holophagales bacterium]|nr:TonB-dependent receptor [Holophagales bacterium]